MGEYHIEEMMLEHFFPVMIKNIYLNPDIDKYWNTFFKAMHVGLLTLMQFLRETVSLQNFCLLLNVQQLHMVACSDCQWLDP